MTRQGIEAGLTYAREELAARMAKSRREPETEASLALAILALLASRESATDVEDDEPRILNFERAKAELAPRRTVCAAPTAGRLRVDSDRPRLKIFCGE